MTDRLPPCYCDWRTCAWRNSATEEIEHLRGEVSRLREHSILLNKISWELHDALGVIPDGVVEVLGDIEDDLQHICSLIRRAVDEKGQ